MPLPSPSLSLLDCRVHIPSCDDPANIHGRVLTSGAKVAFGFIWHDEANSVVRGLELEANLGGEADLSFVTLRGGDQYSCIHAIDKNMILIASAFVEIYPCDVFLIYDTIDRSLRMIPTRPHTYPPARTGRVLIARPSDDGDKSYALVSPGIVEGQDVIFVSLSSSNSPWQMKKALFPTCSRPENSDFSASEVFSFRGRGYWVDLLCGVLYCNFRDLFDVDSVAIRFLHLPKGFKKYYDCREDIAAASAFRAMGPVGDSIKFVSIDGYLEHVDLEDCKVRVWRLMEDMNWAVEYELKLASLWDGVEFEGSLVPRDMAPMYPFLSTEEDNVIYFALGSLIRGVKKNRFPTKPSCMVRVDLHSKTVDCTDLSPSQLTSFPYHLALSRVAADKLLRGSNADKLLRGSNADRSEAMSMSVY